MSKKEQMKKHPGQTAVFLSRSETLMLWQLINSPAVAVRPAEGNAANGLYNKLKKAVADVGGMPAPVTPGGNGVAQQA